MIVSDWGGREKKDWRWRIKGISSTGGGVQERMSSTGEIFKRRKGVQEGIAREKGLQGGD